jgi:hypothetical protein
VPRMLRAQWAPSKLVRAQGDELSAAEHNSPDTAGAPKAKAVCKTCNGRGFVLTRESTTGIEHRYRCNHDGTLFVPFPADAEQTVSIAAQSSAERAIADAARRVTRFEVIDKDGRAYVRHGVSVELSFQDDGRTLKIFVGARQT